MDRTPFMCFICGQPVPLETSKTNEYGRAVHEDCYILRIKLEQATTSERKFITAAAEGTFAGRRRTA